MSELKEFPTQQDYDNNPEYFKDFERRLEQERERIQKIIRRAGDKNDVDTLEDQLLGTGITQANIKGACLTGPYPLWQKIEMFDMAVMYHDIMVEINEILKRRLEGL